MIPTVTTPPRAAALIESMRDIGYSLETALADVIDNSITAGATSVSVLAHYSGLDSRIAVLDNGRGMDKVELLEAMRLGSRSPTEERHPDDLGRFGLGMKTASFSQCRRLTVATRTEESSRTMVARWDLDNVVLRDEWSLELPETADDVPWIDQLDGPGSLVVWEKLDRLVGRSGDLGETEFNRVIREAADHLSLVFYRFLEGANSARKVTISLNGTQIRPIDPFFSKHKATQADPPEKLLLGGTLMTIRTYTLPHFNKVSKKDWERYGGPEGYLKNQGFYVFRGNRLIMHGTWFGVARQSELTKLTRVSVDLPNEMDFEWKIDMKKASAQPPPHVRVRLKELVERMGFASVRTHKERGKREVAPERFPVWRRWVRDDQVHYAIDAEHPLVKGFSEGLDEAGERSFGNLLALFSAALPLSMLHHDVSSSPGDLAPDPELRARIPELAASSTAAMLAMGFSPERIVDSIRAAPPFSDFWDEAEPAVRAILSSGVPTS